MTGPTAAAPVSLLLRAQAWLMLVLTTLFWGGNAVAGKLAVGEVSPMLLTWLRWTLAALLMLVVARHHLRQDWPVIRRRLPFLAMMGALGFTGFSGLLYSGLIRTTAINATIIQAGMPMFIFVLNLVIFRTASRPLQLVGYTITLVGVAVAAGQGNLLALASLGINLGDLMIIAAAIIYASYSVALRSKPQVHWQSLLTALLTAASLAALPLAIIEAQTATFVWPDSRTAWTVVAYTTIFPSLLAQAFFIRANEIIGSNAAGLFLNLIPISGALLSVALLGEQFRLYHAVSLVLVLGGIALAQRQRPA
jgi:drug/metabolite transporter (DMT)-like permease